jgi:hypothetical protein
LSLIHIYWAFGGKLGKAQAVPNVDGSEAFRPSTFSTLAVAFGLLIAMLVSLGSVGMFGDFIPPLTYAWLMLAIALLFLLRAIGDFGLVGFFKKPSDSPFAYWDTRLYSPLCVLVTLLAFAILYLRP